ncbi:MAG: hypothetical protein IPL65_06410 [Lewinellaceae bacterium]|nr:hypothetical protein [Lewinellaceae bacterium]
MEPKEKGLSPQESLKIIAETIALAKISVRENGFHFFLWGWLVVGACVSEYYLRVVLSSPNYYYGWLVMIAIGVPVAIAYEWRRSRNRLPERNVVHNWYGRVWLAFGISLFVTILYSIQTHVSPIPFILVLVGMATFVSGVLLQFKPLQAGAFAFWVGALACLAVAQEAHVLVQAGSTVLGYLVPAHLLESQYKSRHV